MVKTAVIGTINNERVSTRNVKSVKEVFHDIVDFFYLREEDGDDYDEGDLDSEGIRANADRLEKLSLKILSGGFLVIGLLVVSIM